MNQALDLFLTPPKVPRPLSEESFYTTSQRLTFKNGIVAYQWGPKGQPMILLIHGWSGRGTQMGAFAMPLVQRGYQVIAIDGPAHGDSPGTKTNVGAFSQCLIEIENELDQTLTAVIAHSFGAGCSVLAKHRGLKAKKLVLIAGPSKYKTVIQNYLNFLKLSPRSQNYLFEKLEQIVGISAENLNVGWLGQHLHTPCLIVHDKLDKEVKYESALEIVKLWPEAQLLTTENLGHRRILKDPQVIEKVCDFIQSN